MRAWTFPLDLDSSTDTPLFLQISRAIARDIAKGRAAPWRPGSGDQDPGRDLGRAPQHGGRRVRRARRPGLDRNQSWRGDPRGGGLARHAAPVRGALPSRGHAFRIALVSRSTPAPVNLFHACAAARCDRALGGMPDVRLLPIDLLTRAYRRSAKRYGHTLLGYGNDPRGHVQLRTALGQMVFSRCAVSRADPRFDHGRPRQPDGSRSGRAIAGTARRCGCGRSARLCARVQRLPARRGRGRAHSGRSPRHRRERSRGLTRRKRVRLIYVTPHHQYPTTVMLSPTRRLGLLDLARREHIAILEDDYDQEFHYDGRPVLPWRAATATDR